MITHRVKSGIQVVAFCCNWSAYSAIETAGLDHEPYPASLKLVRLPCLGRVNTGMVLRALEMGAAGVLLLGCPAESCRYRTGERQAGSVLSEARQVLALLGLRPDRVGYIQLPAGGGAVFVSTVNDFVGGLDGASEKVPAPASES